MKVLRTGWLWVTLVTLLIVAGCAGSQEPTPVPTATKPPAATPTSTPSGQPAPTPTKATGVSTPTAALVPTATPIPTPVPTLTPKRGGVLKYGQLRDGVGFDPNNTTSGYDNQLNAMYYNGLVWNCYSTDVCPDIAKSWKYTADGKALVFELNNNVQWQKGVKDGVVKAQDVKYSFDKIMGKVEGFTQSERIGWMTNYVTSIDVVDDFTVRFNVLRPAAILPVMMTVGFASVIPAGTTYDQMKTSKVPLGSGPFMIKEHVRGSIYKLVRNPDYFKPGLPYLDGVDMVIIGDANAREAAVLTGVIEIFRGNVSPSNEVKANALEKQGKIVQIFFPSQSYAGVYMNHSKPPFDNVLVRKAVVLAFDHPAYTKTVNDGEGGDALILNCGTNQGLCPDEIRGMKYPGHGDKAAEVAEAKSLMAQAGYPNGFDTVQIYRASVAGAAAGASNEFTQAQLGKIGIRTKLEGVTDPTHFERFGRLDYTVQYYGYAQQLLDPDELYGQYWLCKASRNWTGFCDAKFDAMFPAMSSESDPAKRFALARQMEDYLLREQFVYVPAPRPVDGWVWTSNVHPHPQAAGQPQWYRSWYTEERKETWWKE